MGRGATYHEYLKIRTPFLDCRVELTTIAANYEAESSFTLLDLHLSHIHSKNMCNQIETNWHLVTFFAMQYLYLLNGINHVFMLNHVKDKNCDCVNDYGCYSKY